FCEPARIGLEFERKNLAGADDDDVRDTRHHAKRPQDCCLSPRSITDVWKMEGIRRASPREMRQRRALQRRFGLATAGHALPPSRARTSRCSSFAMSRALLVETLARMMVAMSAARSWAVHRSPPPRSMSRFMRAFSSSSVAIDAFNCA